MSAATQTVPRSTAGDAASAGAPGPDRRRQLTLLAVRLGLVAAFCLAWELGNRSGALNPVFFSSPTEIWGYLVDYARTGDLVTETLATLHAVALSLLIGLPLGIGAGLFLAAFPTVDEVVEPFLVPLNSTPRIALVPVFIIWFGLTTTTKVAVAVSIIFFMVMFNARAGVKIIEPDMLVVSRALGLSKREIFQKVVLPGSVPTIFAGVRLGVTYSILGVVATEMIAARRGLGLDIVKFANTLQVGGVFALLLVLILIAFVAARLLERLERHLLRWQ